MILSPLKSILFHRVTKNIFIFILGFLAGGFFIESGRRQYETPDWAIIEEFDPAENIQLATETFDKRVNDEFPEGIDERKLILSLRKAGFRMDWFAPMNSKVAFLVTRGSGCTTDRQITWVKNTDNKVISISGSYWKKCGDDRDQ